MHYELLTEDISGKKMLDILMPNIIGTSHTFKITAYKGIGRIPPNIRSAADANKRILLDQLPRLLRGYGNTFSKYPSDCRAAVILICDLDNKNYSSFLTELNQVLHLCSPQPRTEFCIAIEEGEAWLLGDCNAIKIAYPSAKNEILEAYRNDSICGTWEVLADAVFPGGSAKLKKNGWRRIGEEKSNWAERIAPKMDIDGNNSPSFNCFLSILRSIVTEI